MRLVHLSLTNFRNFASLQLEVPPGPTLLVGANAQGKTSFLEAVYFLVAASLPHVTSDRQLIRLAAIEHDDLPVARLVAEVEREQHPLRIEIRLVLDTVADNGHRLRKEILINGVKRRAIDLFGHFNAVLFLPQDVQIIEGSPGRRRRQVDASLSQADPEYARSLSEYGKVLTQRNALLKQLQERRGDPKQLDFWDGRLAELGSELMLRRAASLSALEAIASPILAQLTQGRENLSLIYEPAFQHTGDWVAEAIRDQFLDHLQRSRGEHIRRGATLTGPQRDDIAFQTNGLDLRAYGSRGQNRTAMLTYKLAEIEWLRQQRGELPVLLLDEVLAELDPDRRSDLQHRLRNAKQALLTAADASMFEPEFRRQATLWAVEQGKITERRSV